MIDAAFWITGAAIWAVVIVYASVIIGGQRDGTRCGGCGKRLPMPGTPKCLCVSCWHTKIQSEFRTRGR